MLEDERIKIEAIFNKYTDICFESLDEKEKNISIVFSYKSIKFMMYINNYNDIFLRRVNVFAFPEINSIVIPPHFLKMDDDKKCIVYA